MDPNPDTGGPKTCAGFSSGSATLVGSLYLLEKGAVKPWHWIGSWEAQCLGWSDWVTYARRSARTLLKRHVSTGWFLRTACIAGRGAEQPAHLPVPARSDGHGPRPRDACQVPLQDAAPRLFFYQSWYELLNSSSSQTFLFGSNSWEFLLCLCLSR